MQNLSLEAIRDNKKLSFPVKESHKSEAVGKLRYWWCLFAAAMLLLIVGTPTIIATWVLRRKHWLYPFADWGARAWIKACGARVRVRGLENLTPEENYVFISNHRSYLDTATLFAYTGRKIGLVAKKELLKVPILGQGMGFVNIIAIDRTNAEKALQSMKKAREVLDEGYSFGVFAEGTRALPGDLLPFKKGAFHLAIQTGAPIVPVAIRETDWMMGKKTGLAFPGTIEMVLLPPLATKDASDDELMVFLTKTRAAIAEELGRSVIGGRSK
jgi:1-acyl-sn-glycerol-3-phosphate acyltransferase